jgi:hypothetical protein
MSNVIVSAVLKDEQKVKFLSALEALAKDVGLSFNVSDGPHGTLLILSPDLTIGSTELSPIIPSSPITDEIPGVIVAPPPAEIGQELEIAIAGPDAIAVTAPPEETPNLPVQTSTGSCILRNLSSECVVKYSSDPASPCSVLKVSNLIELGEFVSFTFCTMSFKCPIEKQEAHGIYCNQPPTFSSTSIRAEFIQTGSLVSFPILLKLVSVDGSSDECNQVVLGTDTIKVITQTTGE